MVRWNAGPEEPQPGTTTRRRWRLACDGGAMESTSHDSSKVKQHRAAVPRGGVTPRRGRRPQSPESVDLVGRARYGSRDGSGIPPRSACARTEVEAISFGTKRAFRVLP